MACETTSAHGHTRYFVAKCADIGSLRRCIASRKWASRPRVFPPQPHEVLSLAFSQGPVVLVFSVNNCHGWHGYCQMSSPPQQTDIVTASATKSPGHQQQLVELGKGSNMATTVNRESESDVVRSEFFNHESKSGETPASQQNTRDTEPNCNSCAATCYTQSEEDEGVQTDSAKVVWHYFQVDWKTEFLSSFGETCLPSTKTASFLLSDGSVLNKARNWQEMSADVGVQVCSLLDELYVSLTEKRRRAEEAKLAARPLPFIHAKGDVQENSQQYWRSIVEKVERELGRVHLACPFGSQRYNVQQPDSDIDAFVIYQAHTKDILGLNPPKLTLKNSEHETCDYTVLELKRYCELLLSYDARCVETLFLHDSTVVQASDEWRQLQTFRQEFLTRKCLDKYLGDALGSNGVKKLQRILDSGTLNTEQSPQPHVAKLIYIIVRLLQNSVNVVHGQPLQIFRPDGYAERDLLLKIRQADITVAEAMSVIKRLQEEINQGKENVVPEMPSTKTRLESWLVGLRFQDFQTHPPSAWSSTE